MSVIAEIGNKKCLKGGGFRKLNLTAENAENGPILMGLSNLALITLN